ncbi:diacylglycerol/lipid kinase family protein [Candidatus Leptofilum sp.]|uniref:diacylglycerol/lipid kinase family protein n=1 Tax=Candidatus Leptofilum sp. TaxID=3241576 RepID=UPI003B592937
MRVQVILNPWADRGRGATQAAVIQRVGHQYGGVDLVQTERPGHAIELARQAADDGYDLVVAAGGDGTISDVVNGLMRGGKAIAKLGIIPIGSGNDLAWSLKISTDVETAVHQLFTGQPKTIDLARIEDDQGRFRIVDNNIGIGFDAVVVIATENITRIHGFLMYLTAVLRTIATYSQMPKVTAYFDDEKIEQTIMMISFGVGPRGGGGFLLTPDAKQHDDLVDTLTANKMGRLSMISLLLKVFSGSHVHSKLVTMRQSKQIRVRADRPLPIHTDGEMFAYPQDNVREVTVTSLPAAIEVIVKEETGD